MPHRYEKLLLDIIEAAKGIGSFVEGRSLDELEGS